MKEILPHEHEYLTNQIDSYQSLNYMRDGMLVIGNHFIETNMFDPGRRRDRFAIRRTIGDRLLNSDAETVMMPDSLPHVNEAIRAAGHDVVEVPFDAINWQGGSFRCWHHPLVREG